MPPSDDHHDSPSPLRNAIIVVLILLAVLGAWVVTRHIAQNSKLEDCLLAGRRNCAPIDATTGAPLPPR
jgi:hypothetical protein